MSLNIATNYRSPADIAAIQPTSDRALRSKDADAQAANQKKRGSTTDTPPSTSSSASTALIALNEVSCAAVAAWCQKGRIVPISLFPNELRYLVNNDFITQSGRLAQFAIQCIQILMEQKRLPPLFQRLYQTGISSVKLLQNVPYMGACAGESFALMVANNKKMRGDTRNLLDIVDKMQIVFFQLIEYFMGRRELKSCSIDAVSDRLQVDSIRWVAGNPKIDQLNRNLIQKFAHAHFTGERNFDMKSVTFESDMHHAIMDPTIHVMEVGIFSENDQHSMILFLEPQCILYDINHQALIEYNNRQSLFEEAMKYFKAKEQSQEASRFITLQLFTNLQLAPELPELVTLPKIDI